MINRYSNCNSAKQVQIESETYQKDYDKILQEEAERNVFYQTIRKQFIEAKQQTENLRTLVDLKNKEVKSAKKTAKISNIISIISILIAFISLIVTILK